MMVETPGFRLTLLQDPGTAWAAPLRTRGLHDHRQPDGAEQIEEVREVPGIARRATLTLNDWSLANFHKVFKILEFGEFCA